MKRGIKEMNIILASGSPRRKELLAQAGFDFEVEVSNGRGISDRNGRGTCRKKGRSCR